MSADDRVYPPTSVPIDEDFGYGPAQYVAPVSLSSPEGRAQRRPADVPLDASYRSQVLIWREGHRRRVVLPSRAERGDVPHPWGGPVLVISAWNPHGEPRTLRQNTDDQQRLVSQVREHGGTVPGVSWLSRVTTAGPRRRSSSLASRRPRAGSSLPRSVRRRCSRGTARTSPSCPMRLDERPGRRCTADGGPWTSGAIHAAVLWQSHRALLTCLLGCEVCGDGTGLVNGVAGGRGGDHEPRPAARLAPRRLRVVSGGCVGPVWDTSDT